MIVRVSDPLAPATARRRLPLAIGLLVLLAALLFGAWRMRFLCDDAYITFRYVANAHAGRGLVWNDAPFAPVEGYTGFLWALLLWAAWSWFGIEPPDAAPMLSLACGVGQFAIVAAAAIAVRDRRGARLATPVALLVVAAVVTSRTFLSWLTSGLETSLFNLAFVGWAVVGVRTGRAPRARWLALWSLAAALAALTRPDGLLLVAATGLCLVLQIGRNGLAATAGGLAPLLPVAAHVAWRHSFYGEWLPNTYFAKVTEPWPEAGVRYLASFAFEHGTWLWAIVAIVWALVATVRAGRALPTLLWQRLPAVAAISATLFHAGYYVLRVGGDHFEYRVLSQLVPLGTLSLAAMAANLGAGASLPTVATAGLWLASGVGWLHLWLLPPPLPGSEFRPFAPHVPAMVRPLARWFDAQQAWLHLRVICIRCDEHAAVLRGFAEQFPRRMQVTGGNDAFPIYQSPTVGLAAWSLPDCAILDLHGLNDWVIARTPIAPPPLRPLAGTLPDVVAHADADGDGLLGDAELRAALVAFARAPDHLAEYGARLMLTIYGSADGTLTRAQAVTALDESVIELRFMAHERFPPPGYVERLQPNVTVRDGVAMAAPRSAPLTGEDIRRIEADARRQLSAR